MEGKKFESSKLILLALIIFYGVGVVIHLINYFAFALKFLTPIFLLTIFIVIITQEKLDKNFLTFLAVSYLFTFSLEVLGVKTGLVFGRYVYGENLGLKVFDVPLVIGLNWISLLLGSIGFVSKIKISIFLKSAIAGILMVLFDLVLEQVAPSLNYWFWQNHLIPMQNYMAWFIISALLSYYYFASELNKNLLIGRYNFIIQFIFFLILLIVNII